MNVLAIGAAVAVIQLETGMKWVNWLCIRSSLHVLHINRLVCEYMGFVPYA